MSHATSHGTILLYTFMSHKYLSTGCSTCLRPLRCLLRLLHLLLFIRCIAHFFVKMVAKRRLDFSTPRSKRRKSSQPMVLYRGVRGTKPEMKTLVTTISYITDTAELFSLVDMVAGAASGERVGQRIKIWSVEGLIATTASTPIRMDLLLSNDPNGSISYSYDGALDRRSVNPVYGKFLINGTTQAAAGHQFWYRLPYGMVTKYADGTSSSCNHNKLLAALATPSAETITGYFRIWYTDV